MFVLCFFLLFVGAANAGKMVIEITAWEDHLDTLYINGDTMQWYYHGIFQPVGLWNWLPLSTQVPTHVKITNNGITLLDEDWTEWDVLPTFEVPAYSSTLSIPPLPETMNTVDVTFDHSSTDSFAFNPVYPNLTLNFYDPDPEASFHKATVTIYYDRLVDMNDGTIYDTDTQLSWLKDANHAATSGYSTGPFAGRMIWSQAVAWAASLNNAGGVAGLTGWRLPNADPACGMNYNCTTSEMGHLYYTELGNVQGGPVANTDPFTNWQTDLYWTGTVYEPEPNFYWYFDLYNGFQYPIYFGSGAYAWAVRPGARSVTLVLTEELVGVVDELNLTITISTSLNDKLNATIGALERNNRHAAVKILNAFIKAVKVQIGKNISAADANNLIVQAREIIFYLQSQ